MTARHELEMRDMDRRLREEQDLEFQESFDFSSIFYNFRRFEKPLLKTWKRTMEADRKRLEEEERKKLEEEEKLKKIEERENERIRRNTEQRVRYLQMYFCPLISWPELGARQER